MVLSRDELDALELRLLHPTEGLTVEFKEWIDPRKDGGAEKIVKACLALRNRNGGHIFFGFSGKPLAPDVINRPDDVLQRFDFDHIQGLISKFASTIFAVRVEFPEREGHSYPVIVVPSGVTTPVAAKANLPGSVKQPLLKKGDVYFRSLNSSGVASSTLARPEDWDEIMQISINNREGDVARFLKRYFPGANLEAAIVAMRHASTTSTVPTRRSRDFLAEGFERFMKAQGKNNK